MQYEKTFGDIELASMLSGIKISACQTFHIFLDKPLYEQRFLSVEKFHEPGLAPVLDASGAYHISLAGNAVYKTRFKITHGFYCNRAAVKDECGYHHIMPNGERVYDKAYQWAGNYQENICVVKEVSKDEKSIFYHVNLNGDRIYQQDYDYVGDFKDGLAVVHLNDQVTHIDSNGRLFHNKWFKQLGVYHKGYATAADDGGWFHIDRAGKAIYAQRYKAVEPFYNGVAVVQDFADQIIRINTDGNIECIISKQVLGQDIINSGNYHNQISSELAGFWHTYLINAAIELDLLTYLPNNIKILSAILKIRDENLLRLLRALWEIGIIAYDHNTGIWSLTDKGKFLQKSEVLSKAALMWSRVAAESDWLNLPDLLKAKKLQSVPSFKEQEQSYILRTMWYEALIGYMSVDMQDIMTQIRLRESKKIILFGVSSLALVPFLKTFSPKRIDYFSDNSLPYALTKQYDVKLVKPAEIDTYYDLAIFCRFLQNHDDDKVLLYLELVKNFKLQRLFLVEMLLQDDSPVGGAVDINVMVETKGKLRSLKQWQALLDRVKGLQIFEVQSLTPYLSIIDIRLAP